MWCVEYTRFDVMNVAELTLLMYIKSAPGGAHRVTKRLLTDFGEIPEPDRSTFAHENKELIERLFLEPIGRILAFYPSNPAAWLVREDWLRTCAGW